LQRSRAAALYLVTSRFIYPSHFSSSINGAAIPSSTLSGAAVNWRVPPPPVIIFTVFGQLLMAAVAIFLLGSVKLDFLSAHKRTRTVRFPPFSEPALWGSVIYYSNNASATANPQGPLVKTFSFGFSPREKNLGDSPQVRATTDPLI
jgi:hypothetical protein